MLRLPVFQDGPSDLTHDLPPALDLPRDKKHHVILSPPLVRIADAERDGALIAGWHQPYTEMSHSEIETSYGFETRVTHRLVPGDAQSARSIVEHRALYRRPDGAALVRCTVSLQSDDGFYHLDGHFVAEWDGKPVAERSWNMSIPRKHG